jgi:hypothetical protein
MKLGSLKAVGRKMRKRSAKAVLVVVAAVVVLLVAYSVLGSSDDDRAAKLDVAGPPPVSVSVVAAGSFVAAHPFAPYYVVPDKRVKSPTALSKAATNRFVTRPEAALSKGGQAGSPQIVRLQLRATTDDPVTLDGVALHVVSEARPLKGWFTAQPSCDFAKARVAKLYLDSKKGAVRYVSAAGRSSRRLSLPLTRRPATLELQAATTKHRVAWTASLTITHGGHAQTVTVDDKGAPFRVTSPRAARGYAPRFGATGISGFSRDRSWDRGRIKGC